MKQKSVPKLYQNVGRFWGHSKNVKPEPVMVVNMVRHDQIMKMAESWEYKDVLEKRPLSVLYNAAGTVAQKIVNNGKIDRSEGTV